MAVLLPVVALLVMVFVGPVSAATGVLPGSASQFESGDGNMTLEATGDTDWNCFVGTDHFQSGTAPTGCAVTSGAAQTTADGTGELELKPGTKFTDPCVIFQPGSNPPKDEFTNIAEYSDVATSGPTTGDTYLYAGAIRSTNNGNASGNVEFNQKTTGCRTVGDKLLAYEFDNGGTQLVFNVLTWTNNNTCYGTGNPTPPCWGDATSVSTAYFNGESNQSAIAAATNGISGQALGINQFLEFGVDLNKVLGLSGCINFPQNVFESRSSGSSFNSNPEDIEIQSRQINTCGTITIIKHTNPRGLNQSFSFGSDVSNATTSFTSFTLNDNGNRTSDSTGNTETMANVPPGTYHVWEGAEPSGFGFGSVSCTHDSGSSTAAGSAVTGENGPTTINLGSNGSVTCTYVNNQQLGSLKVTKTSVKTSTTYPNGIPLSGATFSVTGPNSFSTTLTTGTDGTACVGNLAFGSYTVTETGAPTGYHLDDTTGHSVSVSTNSPTCGATNATPATIAFSDTPKTDIAASATSEATGGTNSSVTCTDSSNNNVGNSPQGSPTMVPSPSVTATGLLPGTYTCTIVIDP